MKLFKYYSTDECNNEYLLFERLEKLQDEQKIEYEIVDRWMIKVIDIDLTVELEKDLISFFDKLELYPLVEDDIPHEDDEDDTDDFGYDLDDEFDDY